MKTFSPLSVITLVCLSVAFMLTMDTAYAVTVEMSTAVDPEQDTEEGYTVGKVVKVIFTPKIGGTKPENEQTLGISVTGGLQRTNEAGTVNLSNSFSSATNDGSLTLWVKVTGGTSGKVTATWTRPGKNDFTQDVDFDIYIPIVDPPIPKTKLIVLPPIPCYYGERNDLPTPLSELVENLNEDDMPTPLSELVENLNEIETHEELLEAIKPEIDKLEGLAARWDDPDPNANPADPEDMDSPPNIFRVPIVILNANDLSGWQFDIAYNPQILEVIEVSAGNYAIFEGDFLRQGNTTTFFQDADEVNNAAGEIIRISQTRIATGDEVNNTKADLVPQGSPEWATEIAGRKPTDDSIDGANGTGELVSICFRVKEFAEESLGLHNLQLSDSLGNRLNFTTIVHPVVVTHKFAPEDVNRDTVVNSKDLMIIAANLGLARPMANPRADVNNDGIVNVLDLVIVAQHIRDRAPAVKVRDRNIPPALAPAIPGSVAALDVATIQGWIDMAQLEDDGSAIFDLGIANLEALLASRIPSETRLLLNYPNPFNPETWIPYRLAEATEVSISIYAVNGNLVRTLALGHQAAGAYQSKDQAAYWDGRNELGERVASGVYFYTFTAGDFSATGKMLVRK